MFGVIADVLGMGAKEEYAMERQKDQQTFNSGEAALTREYNSAEALALRNWQEHMSNTAVQRHAKDLAAAGFNPLLAIHPGGGATTPSGGKASAAAATSGIASPGHGSPITASMATAAQVEVTEAMAAKVRAETREIEARTGTYEPTIREIESRIPKNQAETDSLRQQIAESAVRIEKLWEDTKVSTATAANLQQQTRNLKETVDQIRAQVGHLKALTAKESAETEETKQRIRQDLPKLEAELMKIEKLQGEMAQPGHRAAEAAQDSLVGQIGAYLRALLPINSYINTGRPRGSITIKR